MPDPVLAQLHADLADALNLIAAYFKSPVITLVVRNPQLPDGDVVLTSEQDIENAITAIRRFQDESKPQPVDDESRCAVCGWPLAETAKEGCVRGNCSLRPRPAKLYSPDRAKREHDQIASLRKHDAEVPA